MPLTMSYTSRTQRILNLIQTSRDNIVPIIEKPEDNDILSLSSQHEVEPEMTAPIVEPEVEPYQIIPATLDILQDCTIENTVFQGRNDTIDILENICSQDITRQQINLAIPNENSSSDTSSSSSSSDSESESEPFNSDDSVVDPTYSGASSDSSSDNDKGKENKRRKVNDPSTVNKVGKKRQKNPAMWKSNIKKKLRNSGQSYIGTKHTVDDDGNKLTIKVVKPEKSLLPPCGEKCKLKCSLKITNEQRTKIFRDYWDLKNIDTQRQFISSNMQPVHAKYKYTNAERPRKHNNAYYFIIEGKQFRVCKHFFMATLAINHRVISTVLRKEQVCESGKVVEMDRRGKHGKYKTVNADIKNSVRNHIKSIPRVESHYCRSHSSKEYIEGSKTVADLHRDYVESCKAQNLPFAHYLMYSKIFNTEFNLAFHLPKKDQCELCLQFKNSNEEEKKEIEEKYTEHIKQKDLSRIEKEEDKRNTSEETRVIVYDLQAVLPCPSGDASSFYYVSKLNVLNFTLYDIKNHEGTCFLWHEGEALRGANEIGTCILMYIKEIVAQSQEDIDIIFYSDNCVGQNKNKFIIAMYLYVVSNLKVKSITHKFFISGHSQSEGDSVHSTIEKEIRRFKKSSPIYAPDQYACIIRSAKKTGHPYKVNELCHSDMIDFKTLATDLFINIPKNVRLSEIKVLMLEKGQPNILLYKTSFEENSFKSAEILNCRRKIDLKSIVLKTAYNKKIEISEAKKKGLLSLIEKKRCVPMFYLNFYKNL